MKLVDLIKKEDNFLIYGDEDVLIKGITSNSREVKDSYIFFAYQGARFDGRDFIPEAIRQGAKVIVTDDPKVISNREGFPNVTWLITPQPKKVLNLLTKRFYNNLDEQMEIVGITGTNGKTTVAYLTQHILRTAGCNAGLLSTIKYFDGTNEEKALNTTPEIDKIFALLYALREKGIRHCVMEVSSHALSLGRVEHLFFKVAGFTNFSLEHLDFHKTMAAYKEAKLRLFTALTRDSFAVYNSDDPMGRDIEEKTKAKKVSYGIKGEAEIKGGLLETSLGGSSFIISRRGQKIFGKSSLLGEIGLYNILCAYGIGLSLGVNEEDILRGIETFPGVPGRLERVETDTGVMVFIDYAHTPKALENILRTLRPLSSRIILIFGCGGDRDKEKRPLMGKIATELADYVIITSDNPRNEDPEKIIADIEKGIIKNNYEKVIDRRAAISRALSFATKGDTVLIAGKGHEEYQIIKDKEIRFSDREEVLSKLKN